MAGIAISLWKTIYTKAHFGDFANFLNKLPNGKNRHNPALQQRITCWLDYLAKEGHERLREQTFLLAKEAAESCVDRTSFYFTSMHILQVEHQILNSEAPLDQVVQAIRENFRLQILEDIAEKHVAKRRAESPGFSEELEIYLAYQYKLREVLVLPVYTELQFDRIADLTDQDLIQVMEIVLEVEKTAFMHYWLTESTLWTAI